MAFGPLIDLPLIVITFLLLVRYRGRLANRIRRIALPAFVLCALTSIPLIWVEEQIDCMPAWCDKAVVPPTLPFIFVEIVVLSALALALHATSAVRVSLAFGVYGIFFEYFLGGLRGISLALLPIWGTYAALTYVYVCLVPLTVLLGGKNASAEG